MRQSCVLLVFFVLVLSMALVGRSCADPLVSPPSAAMAVTDPATSAPPKAANTYGRLPLSFELNRGQTDGRVKFLSRGRGLSLFLTTTEAVMVLDPPRRKPSHPPVMTKPGATREASESTGATVLRMHLAGSNSKPRVTGLEELPGKANYFFGNDSTRWYTNIPTYAKVRYDRV